MNVVLDTPAASPCLRRRGGRPLPVPGPVARRLDPRHQPRRARRHGRRARLSRAADLGALSGRGPARVSARGADTADVRLVHRGLLPMVSGDGIARHAAAGERGGRSRRRTARPGWSPSTACATPPPATRRRGRGRRVPGRWGMRGRLRCRTDRDAALQRRRIAQRRRPARPTPARTATADVPADVLARLVSDLRHRLARRAAPGARARRSWRVPLGRAATSPAAEIAYAARARNGPARSPTRSSAAPRPASAGHPGRRRRRARPRTSWPPHWLGRGASTPVVRRAST